MKNIVSAPEAMPIVLQCRTFLKEHAKKNQDEKAMEMLKFLDPS